MGLTSVATLVVSVLAWLFVRTKIVWPITRLAGEIKQPADRVRLQKRLIDRGED